MGEGVEPAGSDGSQEEEQNNDRLKANTVTYNCVLNALEKGGQVDKCLELLELMGGSSGGGGNGGPHQYANTTTSTRVATVHPIRTRTRSASPHSQRPNAQMRLLTC